MLTLLARLLKVLNSDDNPNQISLAVVLAFIMGLTPLMSPHNLLLLLVVLLVRVNLTMFLLSLGLFTLIAWLLDPLSEQIGLGLLQAESLQGLWTGLYDSSFWRLVGYNNTLILGSLVLSLLLAAPLFLLVRWLVLRYRRDLMAWINRSRIGLWLKGNKFYSLYSNLRSYSA